MLIGPVTADLQRLIRPRLDRRSHGSLCWAAREIGPPVVE